MKIISIKGKKIADYLSDIAHLRMTVFSEYPYLYGGDLDYERSYLKGFVNHKDSFCVLVFDGGTIVGVLTAMPMLIADQAFQDCFNYDDIAMMAYFGESLLLKNYRYQGIGRTFFKLREDYSLQMGFK